MYLGVLNSTLYVSFFHGDLEPGTHCTQSLFCFIYMFIYICFTYIFLHMYDCGVVWGCQACTLTGELIGNGCVPKLPYMLYSPCIPPMSPKARGLAKHGGHLAGWRRVTRQVWFWTWWTGHTACIYHTIPALTGAAQLRADGISSGCYYIVNVHNHPSWAASRKESMACYSIIPMPSLCIPPVTPLYTPSPQLLSSTELS